MKKTAFHTGPKHMDAVAISANAIARMQAIRDTSKIFIEPNGRIGQIRAYLMLFCIIYNLAILPFRIAFMGGYPLGLFLLVDYIGDVIYILDIIIQINFLGFYDKDDIVLVRTRIREKYWSSTSLKWMHVISILPTDLFLCFGLIRNLGSLQSLSLLRLNRLCRIMEIFSFISIIEKHILSSKYIRQLLTNSIVQITKMLVVIYIAAHLAGCVFFLIAHQLNLGNDMNWAHHYGVVRGVGGGVCNEGIHCDSSSIIIQYTVEEIQTQYIYSVYWAVRSSQVVV